MTLSSSSSTNSSPVKVYSSIKPFGGSNLELCIQEFSNTVLIFITENGQPGTWFEVRRDKAFPDSSYDINCLIGDDTEVLQLIVRVVAEEVNKHSEKSLLFSINLPPAPSKDEINLKLKVISEEITKYFKDKEGEQPE